MKSSLFHINPDGSLSVMEETPYDSEDHIQQLLADHPEILAGDQFNIDDPRRWVLVARECAVPDGDTGSNRWSLDHLYLDQDGIPTLVEVNRVRIRSDQGDRCFKTEAEAEAAGFRASTQ